MRMIFSLIGLLVVVAIVGVLAKKQLSAVATLPAVTSTTSTPANIAEQSKQIQTQVKEQLNEAMKATAETQQKALDGENVDKPADKTGSAY